VLATTRHHSSPKKTARPVKRAAGVQKDAAVVPSVETATTKAAPLMIRTLAGSAQSRRQGSKESRDTPCDILVRLGRCQGSQQLPRYRTLLQQFNTLLVGGIIVDSGLPLNTTVLRFIEIARFALLLAAQRSTISLPAVGRNSDG
jgi:hypothetical protein